MLLTIAWLLASAASDTTAAELDLAQRKGLYFCEWRVAVGLTGPKVSDLEICREMPADRIEINSQINRWWQQWYVLDRTLADQMRKQFDRDFQGQTPIASLDGHFRDAIAAAEARDRAKRLAETIAIASPSHPYAGFWKLEDCDDEFGIAIAPAGSAGFYSLSFCGPGGCFAPGTYRPNSALIGDRDYRVVDQQTIEILGRDGFSRYVRCPGRLVDE